MSIKDLNDLVAARGADVEEAFSFDAATESITDDAWTTTYEAGQRTEFGVLLNGIEQTGFITIPALRFAGMRAYQQDWVDDSKRAQSDLVVSLELRPVGETVGWVEDGKDVPLFPYTQAAWAGWRNFSHAIFATSWGVTGKGLADLCNALKAAGVDVTRKDPNSGSGSRRDVAVCRLPRADTMPLAGGKPVPMLSAFDVTVVPVDKRKNTTKARFEDFATGVLTNTNAYLDAKDLAEGYAETHGGKVLDRGDIIDEAARMALSICGYNTSAEGRRYSMEARVDRIVFLGGPEIDFTAESDREFSEEEFNTPGSAVPPLDAKLPNGR